MQPVMDEVFLEYRKGIDSRFSALELLRKSESELVAQALRVQREALDKALSIQAVELERRLTVLNHAHEAAVKEQARVLPREMFDAFTKEYVGWRDSVNSSIITLTSLKERLSGIEGQQSSHSKNNDEFKAEYEKFKLDTTTALSVIATRSATWGVVLFILFSVISIAVAWYRS